MKFGPTVKILHRGKDGGPESHVTGYWLFELKNWFSLALLRFAPGSREAYHSHAFSAWSWVLRGYLEEDVMVSEDVSYFEHHWPRLRPIYTPRNTMHKVTSRGTSWVLTLRGPWAQTWKEYLPSGQFVTLAGGRKVVG